MQETISSVIYEEMIKNEFSTRKSNKIFPGESKDNLKGNMAELFSMKICNKIVKNEKASSDDNLVCKCGRKEADHAEGYKIAYDETTWTSSGNTKCVPTNCYGEISFQGYTASTSTRHAKFIRVSNDVDISKLADYMAKVWSLRHPKMLISVTGGAADFKMTKKHNEDLKSGLTNVATSTGAWIISGGSNAGIMKICGEAVHDYAMAKGGKEADSLVTIGVATWGCIHNKHLLEKHNAIYYKEEKHVKLKGAALDPNHTHFVFVDDGTEMQFGKEMEVRGKLEAEISRRGVPMRARGEKMSVPLVCVVVEGGPGTLQTAIEALKNNTPTVIVEGSGRAADVLAYACNKVTKDERLDDEDVILILKKIEECFNFPAGDPKVDATYKQVEECIQYIDLIEVFKLGGGGSAEASTKDIDIAILKALLKVNTNVAQQLKLALSWNRLDIAKSYILQGNLNFKKEELYDNLSQAILEGKIGFVQLLLEYGLILNEYLTVERLAMLYQKVAQNTVLYKLMNRTKKDKDSTIQTVGKCLKDLIGENFKSTYLQKEFSNNPIENPFRELLIFNLLLMRKDNMKFFWKEGTEQIASALFTRKVLQCLASTVYLSHNIEATQFLEELADEYESLAIGILGKCHDENDEKTQKVLNRTHVYWGDMTCVELAVLSRSRRFIAQTGCQNLFQSIWMSDMAPDTHNLMIIIGIFVPILVLTSIDFVSDRETVLYLAEDNDNCLDEAFLEETALDGNQIEESEDVHSETYNNLIEKDKTFQKHERMPWWKKIKVFYTSPVVTFFTNFISYILFLLLYSHFVLTQYTSSKFAVTEIILVVWVISLTVEEVRQFAIVSTDSWIKKAANYFTDFWNIVDIVAMVLFYTGLTIRLVFFFLVDNIAEDFKYRTFFFDWAHVSYIFGLVVYYLRLMHTCSVHQQLGPKVIMIAKMMQDLIFFLFILSVFLIAYGVASQALLYPDSNQRDYGLVLRGIFYYSYWQMYGELFLEDLGAQQECNPEDPPYPYSTCPQHTILATFLLALYIMLTNVLLLNLLIAMFSYTFERVQENTDLYYKFQLYELIKEYYERPFIPPPFILINHVIFFIRKTMNMCFDCIKSSDLQFKNAETGGINLDEGETQGLIKWEDLNADEFIRDVEHEECDSMENVIKQVDARTVGIQNLLENNVDDSNFSIVDRIVLLQHEVDENKKEIDQVVKLMNWIATALHDKSKASTKPPLINQRPTSPLQKQISKSTPNLRRSEPKVHPTLTPHIRAREINHYEVSRVHVPDDKVPWNENFAGYEPKIYTHPAVISDANGKKPIWADYDFYDEKWKAEKFKAKFNQMDDTVNRASHEGRYAVVDGLPRNIRGRTGLRGRGLLGRFGPNHAADPVVTRYLRDNTGSIIKRKGKNVLEFVAIRRRDTKEFAIPGGMINPGETVSQTLRSEFYEEALNAYNEVQKEKCRRKLDEFLKHENGKELYRGYVDDPRNTDNAWMETIAMNFHDDMGNILENIQLQGGDDADHAIWQEISSSIQLYANHKEIIEKLVRMRNAYWE